MNITTRCLAAFLGFGLVYGPGLATAEDQAPGASDRLTKERSSTDQGLPAVGQQRRADRAVLTLQQDALGRIVRPDGGQLGRPLTPNDPEISRAPASPGSLEIIQL